MNSVIIIGVGKLGIRHLEAILTSKIKSTVWVVDTNKACLSNAEELNTRINHFCHVNFESAIPENLHFELAIVATDSKNRYEIALDLLKKNDVRNLLLEKVIFPISTQYIEFKKVLEKLDCTCYVNLPRRLFPHYQLIKEYTSGCNSFEAKITGSSWGLLSNTLHFVDLIHFLFSEECDFIDLSQITNFFPSKRKGYMEANGRIQLNYVNRGKIVIECVEGNFSGISILLNFDGKQIEIQEKHEGYMRFSWESNYREIHSLMVTNTTSAIFRQLVEENRCGLPVYDEIYKEHQLFIQEIENKFQEFSIDNENQILVT